MQGAAVLAPEIPPRVLVVDDSPIDRALVASLVEKHIGGDVIVAENGSAAFEEIAKNPPDLVLTDLQMPELDGLGLVEKIQRTYPFVPTILMTAHGSEELALAALKAGAASYVNKRNLAGRIAETARDVLSISQGTRQGLRLRKCWSATQFEFQLDNDATLIPIVVNHLQQYQASVRQRDETELIQVGVALHEALRNAMHHGNLELSSDLRHRDADGYYQLAEVRRNELPYRERQVALSVWESRQESRYVIQDAGRGFDPQLLAYDPTDATNLGKPSGRGLFLIRTFMDDVVFAEGGTKITMVRRYRLGMPRARDEQFASA